ncbi:MAG: anti-sigma factor antagonist [Paenibacillus sp.]|nr:anti-sigma factor antagonist [Paenibacillus sp.]
MTIQKFNIDWQESQEEVILLLNGELDLSVAPEFRSALERIVNRADVILVLDLQRLKYIDSTGIGILVSVLKIRDEINAPFLVRNIPPAIRKLFDLTGISGFLIERT